MYGPLIHVHRELKVIRLYVWRKQFPPRFQDIQKHSPQKGCLREHVNVRLHMCVHVHVHIHLHIHLHVQYGKVDANITTRTGNN